MRPRPTPREIDRAFRALAPWRRLTRPRFEGMERVPDTGPLLFVGNHTLFGVLDVPLFAAELYAKRGIFVRGLADHRHFQVAGWGSILERLGIVDGTRENCGALLRAGEAVLVFPGGAREVAKRRGEAYKLLWGERVGFATMAIAHGATIVPFAEVGAEETYRILYDGDDLLRTPVGALLRRFDVKTDFLPPVAVGIGPFPRPRRMYFHVGEPIRPEGHTPESLRDRTRDAIEAGIAHLLALREGDPHRSLRRRLVSR